MRLVNFTIEAPSSHVRAGGQVFDLHNALLQGYHYATKQQRLTLDFQSRRYQPDTNIVTTDLHLVFDQVFFLRLQQTPSAEYDPALVSMEFLNAMASAWQGSTMEVQVANLFSTVEIDELGVQEALFISFWGGPDLLIGAATATLFFAQANTIEA